MRSPSTHSCISSAKLSRDSFDVPSTTPDGYHHTAEDTMDKISAKSLQVSADLFLEMIRLINLHG